MTERPWWQTAVFYQIYPRSFQDTTGNGVGDLAGVTRRLDYLADVLGVDALWLSPFQPSPMADFGYDVADYCNVDPLFGTLDDADELITQAHRRGLRLIIDWVPNHTSDEHPWFRESRAARASARRDWYTWRDPGPGGGPPNNWLSVFGGPAWTLDHATGQYYLHSFLPQQPDLNWRNPDVEAAMIDTLRFWLDRGVDGFRIDVAHFVMKDPELRDDPPVETPSTWFKDLDDYGSLRHVHSQGHPDVHGVYRRIRQVLDEYGDRFSVGEVHLEDLNEWARYYGADLDEMHMPFNFSLLYAPWSAASLRDRIDELEAAVPNGGWPNYVLGNHDEPRLITRFGAANARAAALLLLTLRGTPTLYYGDELGLPSVSIPDDRVQDPWGRRVPGMGRDGCRTPMPWEPGPGAGFCDAAVPPWLPIDTSRPDLTVSGQLADTSSILNLYRRLLHLRRTEPALKHGDYSAIDPFPTGCLGYRRSTGDDTVVVALNVDGPPTTVPFPEPGRVVLDTHDPRPDGEVRRDIRLDPGRGVVVRPARSHDLR